MQPAEAGREREAVRVLLRRGVDVLPPSQRDQRASGLILAFTLTGLEAEGRRLRSEGVESAMPLREEPWGRKYSWRILSRRATLPAMNHSTSRMGDPIAQGEC